MAGPHPTRGALRRARGGVAGLATGVLAVSAHVGANGRLPSAALTVLLIALVAWAASGLAGCERGPRDILALLSTGQVAVHVLLTLTSRDAHAAHHGHGGTSAEEPGLMVAAHVVATLALTAVLTCAERALFALTAAIGSVLPRRLAPLPATAPLTILFPTAPPPLPVTGVLRRTALSRRGPPARG
ncbi:hypothetical protein [Umezawaea beigongshangensis]|uniref:hypothetical protein n=1 Tax=Umezawaea beigongshangensis TaxID=2780383 RepID=UPI0027DBA3B8|nr:hypothetical protein [Umezawaea beigongshangensis]